MPLINRKRGENMKRVDWAFETIDNFKTLSEESQMSTTGGKFSWWDLLPDWTDAVEWLLELGTITAYAPTVC
jgi:hypothetical protein